MPENLWAAYSPDDRQPWDLRRVVHLHRRAAFAGTWGELQREKLAGPLVVRGDEKWPVTVKLEPAAALTGQFVTHDGKPLADLELSSLTYEGILGLTDSKDPQLTLGAFPRGFRTDRDGKLRIDGLAPGLKYRVALLKGPSVLMADGDAATGVIVKTGETKDLGVIKINVNANDGQE
jgi:hypothetical protein